MKKLTKKLVAFFAVLVLALTPLALVGCGDNGLSLSQINELVSKSAKSFYSNHKDTENYSAITYHWVKTETEKLNEVVEYKEHTDDEEFISGTFERKTVDTEETTLAIKKEGNHLVAEMTTVYTETRQYKEADAQNLLVDVNYLSVETNHYRMFHYTEESETQNILIFEKNRVIDGENIPGEVVKWYGSKANMDDYDEFVQEYLIGNTNKNVANNFFDFTELLLFYQAVISAEQNGNQTKINAGYNIVGVDNNTWSIVTTAVNQNTYFKDGKIWKADVYTKVVSENLTQENSVTFDYVESANVNMTVPTDFTGYTETDNVWTNGGEYSFGTTLNNTLPTVGIFQYLK